MNQLGSVLSDRASDLFSDDQLQTISTTDISTPLTNDSKLLDDAYHDVPSDAPSALINVAQIKSRLLSIERDVQGLLQIIDGHVPTLAFRPHDSRDEQYLDGGERVVEGVFNGEKMIGPDGREYAVPPNYASKSKIVEGDMMKLTITNSGKFIYKQIAPVVRRTIHGELVQDPDSLQWGVLVNGKVYKVLKASITFYHAKSGDEIFILVPDDAQSAWGAVENVIGR